jgi:hypothetical protein
VFKNVNGLGHTTKVPGDGSLGDSSEALGFDQYTVQLEFKWKRLPFERYVVFIASK